MRRSLLVAVSATLLAVVANGAAAGTASFEFQVVETPAVPKPGLLTSVVALGPSDVRAVGEAGGKTLVERWNGTGWVTVPVPTPGDSAALLGTTALGPNDAWAVGVSHRAMRTSGLIEHWDGSSWSVMLTGVPFDLNSVHARAPNDVWAVGAGPFLTHWDGLSWEPAPHAPIEEGELHGVVALARDDAWAVGAMEAESNPPHTESLLFHWQGSVWELMANPAESAAQELWAVDGTSSSDVWAVGFQEVDGRQRTLTMHYDGTSWTVRRARDPGAVTNRLVGVAAITPTNVWAVGTFGDGVTEHPMAQHWDGTGWRLVRTEDAPGAPPINSLLAVDASGPDNVWAVGMAGPTDQELQPLVERLIQI